LVGAVTEPGDYNTPALSPDGTRVAFQRRDPQGNNVDIWVQELTTGRRTRFTMALARDWMPVWSADSRNIVFGSQRDGGTDNLYQKDTSGVAAEVALLKTAESKYPQDLSRDGRFLLYANVDPRNSYDLWVLPLEGERKPKLIVGTQSRESAAKFSPDGRFIAYTSDATGRNEVYVRAFSPDGNVTAEWPVSKDGGTQPVWRQDGKELFFISGDSKMMVVPVTTAPAFKAGIPEALFTAPILGGGSAFNIHRWDTLDGKRFLINSSAHATSSSPITLVLNWQAGLKK
jgi:Tol biopolymer transport system component